MQFSYSAGKEYNSIFTPHNTLTYHKNKWNLQLSCGPAILFPGFSRKNEFTSTHNNSYKNVYNMGKDRGLGQGQKGDIWSSQGILMGRSGYLHYLNHSDGFIINTYLETYS